MTQLHPSSVDCILFQREVKSTMIAIKPPHLAEFKDAAGEDRGWLLATSPHDPTRRYPFSRCTAGRSVIHPRARRTLMIRWGSGSKPTLDPPRCPLAAKAFYILERRRPRGIFFRSESGDRRGDEWYV
ncbi:hypothetical protein T10_10959 [Trichinella papuae]|uniref:Uncharacterized protein n=1 Tax=Trichinella papuae TaxID=268474 RepID=A0A0V1M6G5_9BILA|nr:hypothetical protein T10_10959 [Trichinella papuae]